MRTLLSLLTCAALLTLPLSGSGVSATNEVPSVAQPAAPPSNRLDKAQQTMPASEAPPVPSVDPIVAILSQGGDPFQARVQTGSPGSLASTARGMIPAEKQNVPADIRVRGLVRFVGKKPAALLQLRPDEPSVIVHQGDLIFVRSPHPGTARRGTTAQPDAFMYLLVDEIKDDCLLVAPKKNPDALMMLR